MKNSERLKAAAAAAENDFKSIQLHAKSRRASRMEKFIDELPKLTKSEMIIAYEVREDLGKVTFRLEAGRIIDVYPKNNKLLERRGNTWHNDGINKFKKILKDGKKEA